MSTTAIFVPPIVLANNDYDRLSAIANSACRRENAIGYFLAEEITRARIVAPAEVAPSVVTMNSQVEFMDDQTGQVRRMKLVYPEHADILHDRISVLTPVGAALIGLSEGQSMQWKTRQGKSKSLTVLKVHFQPERSLDAASIKSALGT